ncbi:MAG: tRNA (N(6)-L-threonylcarbamoyladenosine(37)-C(2))-methylthiotransferase MtaB, partial [Sphingomicrobium sp.]
MAVGAPAGSLIVNSCAVTSEAVRQTRQAIRRAYRLAPERPIIVTGCAAQLDPEAFRAMPEVTVVRTRDDA